MNSDGFDFLVQQMGGGLTRRAGLRLMPGLGLLIGMLSAAEIAHLVVAKKRKRRKKPKKKPKCRKGQTVCRGACISSAQCCTSDECSGGKICQDLDCVCSADRPGCPQVSTETCCAAPPGLPVPRISCGSIGEHAACVCEYRAVDVCGAGCPSFQLIVTDCATVDREDLDDFCLEIGCDPPS